jgi:uncharacterized membrane protein (DUF2068 family)
MHEDRHDDGEKKQNRLLPLIGVEHVVVALILLTVGVTLATNAHTNVGNDVTHLARRFGLDPSSNGIRGLTSSAKKLTPDKLRFYGIAAVGFGLLEGIEGYGLIPRRRWGEYLTVVATLLLFVPDIYQLAKEPSILKGVLFALNVAMIVYLAIHLWRTRGQDNRRASAADKGWHGAPDLAPARSA